MPLRHAGRADIKYGARRPRERLVPAPKLVPGCSAQIATVRSIRREARDAAAQSGPLVRRDERVHAPGKRLGESLERDARRHAERRQLVAQHLNELAEERVLAGVQHEDDLDHGAILPDPPVGPGPRIRADAEPATTVLGIEGGDAIWAIACPGIVGFHVGTGALYASGNLDGSGGHYTWMTGYGEVGRVALRSFDMGSTCSSCFRASSCRRPSWRRSWRAARARAPPLLP